jgi:hypothetical protein
MKSLISLGATALAAIALTGCTAEGQKANVAKVRTFNAVFESGPVRLTADGAELASQLNYAGFAGYVETAAGTKNFEVFNSGGTKLFEVPGTLGNETTQLFIVAGATGNYSGLLLDDTVRAPGDNRVRVRFVHAAFGTVPYDVYLTAPTDDIANFTATLVNIGYRGNTGFFEVASATYKLRLTAASTKEVLYESDTFTLNGATSTTFVAFPTDSGKLMNVAQLAHDAGGAGTVLTSKIGRVKLVNAVAGTTVNGLVDGTQLFPSVPSPGLTSYLAVANGTRQIRLEPSVTPGSLLATTALTVQPARDYLVIATGNGTAATLTTAPDKSQILNIAKIRLRVINAVAGGGAVNLFVNTAASTSNIAALTASPFVELDQGTFDLTVKSAATGATLFNIPAQVFGADNVGKAYAITLTGTSTDVRGGITLDP